jgi:small subunit ribosomal protein S9
MLAILRPLQVTDTTSTYNVSVHVGGGGLTGQAGAAAHGIARALCEADENLRPVLKKGGFLVRDPRAKERKKYGLKRARKAPQYTKR